MHACSACIVSRQLTFIPYSSSTALLPRVVWVALYDKKPVVPYRAGTAACASLQLCCLDSCNVFCPCRYCTDPHVIQQRGLSDPRPFFEVGRKVPQLVGGRLALTHHLDRPSRLSLSAWSDSSTFTHGLQRSETGQCSATGHCGSLALLALCKHTAKQFPALPVH